jgi:hypothetical protein
MIRVFATWFSGFPRSSIVQLIFLVFPGFCRSITGFRLEQLHRFEVAAAQVIQLVSETSVPENAHLVSWL